MSAFGDRSSYADTLDPKQVNWDTRSFNDESEWPEDGSQPFVLSTGDE